MFISVISCAELYNIEVTYKVDNRNNMGIHLVNSTYLRPIYKRSENNYTGLFISNFNKLILCNKINRRIAAIPLRKEDSERCIEVSRISLIRQNIFYRANGYRMFVQILDGELNILKHDKLEIKANDKMCIEILRKKKILKDEDSYRLEGESVPISDEIYKKIMEIRKKRRISRQDKNVLEGMRIQIEI